MPYAPSVNDNSGQIWGNAISNIGNTIAGTITAYKQQSDQNKLFDSKSKSVENLIKTHSSEFGLSKEQLDAMLSRDPHETPQARYERLSGTIDNAVMGEKIKQYAQQQQQQQKLAQLSQYQGGVGQGVLSPEAQSRLQRMAGDPYMSTAARLQNATGRVPDDQTLVTAVEKYQNKGPVGLKIGHITQMDDQGNPVDVSIDENTGKELGRGPKVRPVLSPAEQGQAEEAKVEAQKKVESATGLLNGVRDSAESARARSASIGRIMDLYDQGATTGFGQDSLTKMGALMSRVSGKKDIKLANQQQLQTELQNLVMESGRELMKGGGAVSNYERELVQSTMANTGNSPEANRQVLGVMKRIADRSIALEKERVKLEDQGLSSSEIAKRISKLRESMPIVDQAGAGASPVDALLEKYK